MRSAERHENFGAVAVRLLPLEAEQRHYLSRGKIPELPAVFLRTAPKEYGTQKAAEGVPVSGKRVVAVEDVVTTAGALVSGCLLLRGSGALVETAVCAIDRE